MSNNKIKMCCGECLQEWKENQVYCKNCYTFLTFLIDRVSCYFQLFLWFIGIAWHNTIRDECSKDFNCCADCGRFAFIKFRAKRNE